MNQPAAGSQKERPVSRSKLLTALSNEIRIDVLVNLARAQKCVKDIAADLQLDQPTVSHALLRLQKVKLVDHERSSKHHIYYLTDSVKPSFDGNTVHLEIKTNTVMVSLMVPVE
ncbi:MAG: winged helix-turn-helix domain-containing protein [Phycisphaerales bacterium]|nr:winged helix-turn-helix domain-containing protein [Phycisphaerales bacterium]